MNVGDGRVWPAQHREHSTVARQHGMGGTDGTGGGIGVTKEIAFGRGSEECIVA